MTHQNSQLYYPTDIALKMTDYCPNNCYGKKYCFAGNTSNGKKWIDRDRIKEIFQQAKRYAKLKQLHQLIDAKRKIIKIGNSMGFTLPDRLQDFGAKIGKEVKIEALSSKSFKVELLS